MYTSPAPSGRGRREAPGESSPAKTQLAAASPCDRPVRLWDPASSRLRLQIRGHAGGSTAVSFSPDGGRLATSGTDGMVRLWRPDTGELLASLDGRSPVLYQVAFSADGRTLAAVGIDHHVRVWDVADVDGVH